MNDRRLRRFLSESSGSRNRLDLAPLLSMYKVYKPLRNDARLFASARLIEDGCVVAWDGSDLEMTAELIETLAEQAMTAEDFARFLTRHKLTHAAAAAQLGRSRRQIEYYLKGEPIPRVVALACCGYEAQAAKRKAAAA